MMKGLLLAALTFLTVTSGLGDQAMNPKVIDKDAFAVIGISARTSNRREVTDRWRDRSSLGTFLPGKSAHETPHKADPNMVAVYADYASDHNGESI